MPYPEPAHPGHTFLGYRGVSKRHFTTLENQAIRYKPPPASVAGSSQLGAGVYMTNHVRDALDYAKDSAWNYYCSMFSKAMVDDDGPVYQRFITMEWRNWGRVHAVFMPSKKFESERTLIADFSHINIDRMGEHAGNNMMRYVDRNRSRVSGVKSQLFDGMQTIIYPPHTQSLFVQDITDDVVRYFASGGD